MKAVKNEIQCSTYPCLELGQKTADSCADSLTSEACMPPQPIMLMLPCSIGSCDRSRHFEVCAGVQGIEFGVESLKGTSA